MRKAPSCSGSRKREDQSDQSGRIEQEAKRDGDAKGSMFIRVIQSKWRRSSMNFYLVLTHMHIKIQHIPPLAVHSFAFDCLAVVETLPHDMKRTVCFTLLTLSKRS